MAEWQDWQSEQEEEWGQWEAIEQIEHGGALAYDVGHPVPHSNVVRHEYDKQGLVKRVRPAAKRQRRQASDPTSDHEAGTKAEGE